MLFYYKDRDLLLYVICESQVHSTPLGGGRIQVELCSTIQKPQRSTAA